MTPGNLAGTLVLLLFLAALIPTFQEGINHIQANTSGITSILVGLVLPFIAVAILANLWDNSPEAR